MANLRNHLDVFPSCQRPAFFKASTTSRTFIVPGEYGVGSESVAGLKLAFRYYALHAKQIRHYILIMYGNIGLAVGRPLPIELSSPA
jgi:hypothetical protein